VLALTNRSIDGSGAPTPIHLDFTPTSAQRIEWGAYTVKKAVLHMGMGPFTTGLQCVGLALCYDNNVPTTTLSNAGMVLNHNCGEAIYLTTAEPQIVRVINNPSHPILGSTFDSITGITESREPVRVSETWNCGHFYVQPIESNVQYIDTWIEYVVEFSLPRSDS
jgi:hypothetical protein